MRVFSRSLGIQVVLRLSAALVVAVGLVSGASRPIPARADTTITVDTLDGGLVDDPDDGPCSLAEAIANANNDGGGTIYDDCALGTGIDTIVFSVSGTINLSDSLPTILDPQNQMLFIDGGGDITLDGGDDEVIVQVDRYATLQGLVVQNASNGSSDGGVIVSSGAELTVTESLFYSNYAAGWGGAIYNAGVLLVERSTFTSNSAGVWGGAIANIGTATISNSTFVFNSAAKGGAVYSSGTLTMYNNTLSGNSASTNTGAALEVFASTANIYNTIMANSTAGEDCVNDGGTVGGNNNLIEDDAPACGFADGVNGNVVGVDPMLEGGHGTPAFLPLKPTSPAIDAGNNSYLGGASIDEPGYPRTDDVPWVTDTGAGSAPIVDMGASEYQFDCPVATRLYVDANSTEEQNGLSWTFPYQTLQPALYTADECIGITEIWVANGEYKPGPNRTDSFNIPPGVWLYGGFAGGETLDTERDWDTNVTVLSGDADNDDTTDGNGVVTSISGNKNNNNYHVVVMDGTAGDSFAPMDGFTITAGRADGSTDALKLGGGMVCDGHGATGYCAPGLLNLTFSGNYAVNGAGALFNDGGLGGYSSPNLINVSFLNNQAGNGGALTNYGFNGASSPIMQDVTFLGNTATSSGGAIYNEATGGESSPQITRATFGANQSASDGGAIYTYGSGGEGSSPTLSEISFNGNTAGGDGGAIFSFNSSPQIQMSTFRDNHADGSGGALYNDGSSGGTSSPQIISSTFYNNSADDGGAIYNNGDGGIASPQLIDVTFHNNQSAVAGGAMYNSAQSGGTSNPSITNSVFWGNTGLIAFTKEIANAGGSPGISHSLVEGSGGSGGGWSGVGVDLGGNLDANPLLGPLQDNGGLTETMALLAGSPAIDTADDGTCENNDQRGEDRPQGPHCDMGAYEFAFYEISGNAGVVGVTLSYVDGGPQTATSDSNGDYTFTIPEHWSGTVTPSKTNYGFTPDDRVYADVTADQLNQDYAAFQLSPTIAQVYPAAGAVNVCLKPQVGVALILSPLVRLPSGAFDPSTVTLKLDNVDRTGQASILQSVTNPASHVTIVYTPTSNLSTGNHTGSFIYPSAGGPVTYDWSFTVSNSVCPTSAPALAPPGTTPGSEALSIEASAAIADAASRKVGEAALQPRQRRHQ